MCICGIDMSVCTYVNTHMDEACRGQRLRSSVFLCCSPLYCLRQGLFVEPRTHWTGQQASEFHLSLGLMSSAKLSFLKECGVSTLKFSLSHSWFPTEPSPKPDPLEDDLLVCVCTCIQETERSVSHYVLCACGQEQVARVGSILHVGPKIKLIHHHTGGQKLNFISHFTSLKKKKNKHLLFSQKVDYKASRMLIIPMAVIECLYYMCFEVFPCCRNGYIFLMHQQFLSVCNRKQVIAVDN